MLVVVELVDELDEVAAISAAVGIGATVVVEEEVVDPSEVSVAESSFASAVWPTREPTIGPIPISRAKAPTRHTARAARWGGWGENMREGSTPFVAVELRTLPVGFGSRIF